MRRLPIRTQGINPICQPCSFEGINGRRMWRKQLEACTSAKYRLWRIRSVGTPKTTHLLSTSEVDR